MSVVADVPTLGLLIGGPITLLLLTGFLGAFFYGRRMAREGGSGYGGWSDGKMLWFWSAVAFVVTFIVAGLFFWPWKHDYHFWIEKSGEVEKISNRFVSAGTDKGTEQKFVFVINGQPYGVTDTRAALVKEGDFVRLACKKAFQWGSSNHGWDCRWDGE